MMNREKWEIKIFFIPVFPTFNPSASFGRKWASPKMTGPKIYSFSFGCFSLAEAFMNISLQLQ